MASKVELELVANTRKASTEIERFSSGASSAMKALGGVAAGALAVFSAKKMIGAVSNLTKAASIQEDAVNALNSSLQLAGDFSAGASKDLQAFAADMQKVTKIGDETSLKMLGLAKSFGVSNEDAKRLVTSAVWRQGGRAASEALASRAYEDTALPIGCGQTISQPFVVARMIELLIEDRAAASVLEVGTGCGYQAAVMARIFTEVYSIERIKALLERARANLLGMRIANLRLAHGDGYAGLEKAAPFASIIVAAAAPRVPDALLRQLGPGGRMVLPLRAHAGGQRLVLIERSGRSFVESELDAVRFVPMEAGKQ